MKIFGIDVPWLPAPPMLLGIRFGQDASESKTGYSISQVGGVRYEINVSIDGTHVFATDSRIRNYTDSHIAYLVGVFAEKFPGSKIDVKAERISVPELPTPVIQAAMAGSLDMERLRRDLRREQARVGLIRSDDYFGDETADEVCSAKKSEE